MNNTVVLLLTGCVKPNITNDVLAVTDVEIRKRKYVGAIRWYLENTPFRIVFCENSGTDLSSEFNLFLGGRIEFLTFVADKKGAGRDKGYREMEILEHIQECSEFFQEGSFFVKITGRLVLLNVCKLVNSLSKFGGDFVSAYMSGRYVYSDSRFIFFTKPFFPILLGQKEKLTDYKHNFEYYTFISVMEARKKGIKFIYPPMAERVHGVSGGFGKSYDLSNIGYLKLNLINQVKRLLFGIGIYPMISAE